MDEVDIIVVGGGSGGAAAAGRLSESSRFSVALLEAGGRNTGLRTRIPAFLAFQTDKTNWHYETVPQAGLGGRRLYQPRGKGLGGSSAINAMVYIRGNRWDYDNWAAMGCSGWSYDDVLPWFRRSEKNVRGASAFHGGDGPLWVSDQLFLNPGTHDFIEAGASLQIPHNDDFNGPRQEGIGVFQVTQKGGERWSSARAYLGDGTVPSNLSILLGVTAERILFEDNKACGVAYVQDGQRKVLRARRAVILAGGVFGTPQLLMPSGIGPGGHLREHGIEVRIDRTAVGSNLHDHVDYFTAFDTPGAGFVSTSLKGTARMAGAFFQWLRNRQGMLTTPFAEAGAFLTVMPDAPAPDVQLHFVVAALDQKRGRTAVNGHGFTCHVSGLRPESRGTVRLTSGDVRTMPLIDPAFLTEPGDIEVMKHGIRAMYRIVEASPLHDHKGRDRYSVDLSDDAALEQLVRARSGTVFHPVGTARMGSDDAAVCDPHLRVRGVDGLYIADASVMPRLISGNTNAASIMIGERCADFVITDWK